MDSTQIHWKRVIPFIFLHATLLLTLVVGVTPMALVVCFISYILRMFAITGFYHRYFSHKSFKAAKWVEILFASIGASACQRGPIWWASMHRRHHLYSDQDQDPHAARKGFVWTHFKWFLINDHFEIDSKRVKDLLKSPGVCFIDRFDMLFPVIYTGLIALLGAYLQSLGYDITPLQAVIWGFFVSTVLVMHATFCVNSLCHIWGKKRFPTKDNSRNNGLVALITLGEGWHNNHHFAPGTAKQGFHWAEVDLCYLCLKFMSLFGLVWDLKPIPEHVAKQLNTAQNSQQC